MHTLWAYLSRDPSTGEYRAHVREMPGGLTHGDIPKEAIEAVVTAIRAIASVATDADLDLNIRFSSGRDAQVSWVPGMFMSHGTTGYTLDEAGSAVGPGWAVLVDAAYRRLTDAGCTITQVKEKFAGLRIYFDRPTAAFSGGVERRSASTLDRYLAWLENKSLKTCEACGALGTQCKHLGWLRTLCSSCAWRWKEGAGPWSEIRGEWPPPLDSDPEE
jgi:predicted RNase H-like HicB family nuclease